MDMATAEAGDDGFEFPSDPVDRFPLPDLAGGESILGNEPTQTLVCTPAKSNIDDVGEAALTVQLDVNSACEGAALSVPNSEQSTGKDDPQNPGWTKRVGVRHAPTEYPPSAGRISALKKTLRGYAEKKTDTVIVPSVGSNFDSLGEAYDYYNLYSWEIEFGIRYGKSRLNVERTKCMQEIVCGCSLSIVFRSLST